VKFLRVNIVVVMRAAKRTAAIEIKLFFITFIVIVYLINILQRYSLLPKLVRLKIDASEVFALADTFCIS